jgi:hypothetical protein
VATAFYRLLPDVQLKDDFFDDEAERLVEKCPMKVRTHLLLPHVV